VEAASKLLAGATLGRRTWWGRTWGRARGRGGSEDDRDAGVAVGDLVTGLGRDRCIAFDRFEVLAVADAQLRHGVGGLAAHDRVHTDRCLHGGGHVRKLITLTVWSDASLGKGGEEALLFTELEGSREVAELILETLSRIATSSVFAPFMAPKGIVLPRVGWPMLEHGVRDRADLGGVELLVGAGARIGCDVSANAGRPEAMQREVVDDSSLWPCGGLLCCRPLVDQQQVIKSFVVSSATAGTTTSEGKVGGVHHLIWKCRSSHY
jgi:hypothetical protein